MGKRKRSKPVVYHGTGLKPKSSKGYDYLRDRNPAQDVEKEQMENLIRFVYDNPSSF